MKIPTAKQLSSGAYRVQVMVAGQRVSVTDEDPKVAVAKAMAIKAKMEDAKKSPRSMTVGEAIDRYIESKDAVLSPSTIRGYKRMRRTVFPDLANLKLKDLTQETVQRAINKMAKNYSPKSVRNAHGLLSATLATYNPDFVLRTTLPQKQKFEIQIPTQDEIKKILSAAKGTEMEIPLLLAVWLGLRLSEIRGLTWDCVNGNILHVKQAMVDGEDGAVLKGTKSFSGNRKIIMPDYLVGLISAAPRKNEYIVSISGNTIYEKFQKICRDENLPHYRFHDLRHVNASIMLALGVPDKYAMERMGHATTNMLKTVYQHTMKSEQEQVAEKVNSYFEDVLL